MGILSLMMVGCTPSNQSQNNSHSKKEENQQMTEEVTYHAVVIDREEDAPVDRLLVSNVKPINPESSFPSYDEVVLLMEGVEVVFEDPDEEVDFIDLAPGTLIEMEWIHPTPMTMSLPPQVPGRAIRKITILKEKEDTSSQQ